MTQKMHGPSDTDCPLWQKPMSKVCHKCAWWTEIPQKQKDGQYAMVWACAQVALVIQQDAVVRATLGAQQATESMRNEITDRMDNPKPIELVRGPAPLAIGNN